MKKKTDWCKQNVHQVITNNLGITWCTKCGLLITCGNKTQLDNLSIGLTNKEIEDKKKKIRNKLKI